MIYICFDDVILKNAKYNRIAKNSKRATNVVLWSGLGVLIGTGVIGIKLIGECLIIGSVNKSTKWIIKHRKDIREKINTKFLDRVSV